MPNDTRSDGESPLAPPEAQGVGNQTTFDRGRNAPLQWEGIILGFGVCRAIAETGVYPWHQEAIP